MARRTVAQFYADIERAISVGKKSAIQKGATVIYKATLAELAAGSPGQGRVYQRGGKKGKNGKRRGGVTHRASASGSAPARDTGTLIRSVGMQVDTLTTSAVIGVKRSAPYAKFLDPAAGQREPRIGRRPFLSSAWSKNQLLARQAIREELERTLRSVGRS